MKLHDGTTTAAAPAYGPPSCESGYSGWQDYESAGWLLSPNIKGDFLVISPSDASCWHFPDSDTTGEIEDEAGYCAQYDSQTGDVESFKCTGSTPQECEISSGCTACYGHTIAANEWAVNHGQSQIWMNDEDGADYMAVDLEGIAVIPSGVWEHG
jgi:hypothetical protein